MPITVVNLSSFLFLLFRTYITGSIAKKASEDVFPESELEGHRHCYANLTRAIESRSFASTV